MLPQVSVYIARPCMAVGLTATNDFEKILPLGVAYTEGTNWVFRSDLHVTFGVYIKV